MSVSHHGEVVVAQARAPAVLIALRQRGVDRTAIIKGVHCFAMTGSICVVAASHGIHEPECPVITNLFNTLSERQTARPDPSGQRGRRSRQRSTARSTTASEQMTEAVQSSTDPVGHSLPVRLLVGFWDHAEGQREHTTHQLRCAVDLPPQATRRDDRIQASRTHRTPTLWRSTETLRRIEWIPRCTGRRRTRCRSTLL